jgi:hypothetical protein
MGRAHQLDNWPAYAAPVNCNLCRAYRVLVAGLPEALSHSDHLLLDTRVVPRVIELPHSGAIGVPDTAVAADIHHQQKQNVLHQSSERPLVVQV